MTWVDVFRRDLRSAYRSRMGPAVALVLLATTVGIAGIMAATAHPRYPPDMSDAVSALGSVLSFVIPLAALLASFSAVVGERTTGSVRFLLGLPNSRTDAFVGKFLSRLVVVLAPLVVGMVGAAAVVATSFTSGSFVGILLLCALAVPYAVLFVGIGLSASVVADSDVQAVALAIGSFVVFRAGWPAAQWLGLQSIETAYPRPEWYFWVGRVNPMNAFVRLTTPIGAIDYHPLLTHSRDLSIPAVTLEFALAVLIAWTLAAPVLGYVAIRRRDLL